MFAHILQNQPKFREKQIKDALFKNAIYSWDEVSNLPKELIDQLKEFYPLELKYELIFSKDQKTIKAIIQLSDDSKIESVLMMHEDRNTVCVSSQVGCAMNCAFCATGKLGFKRNLTVKEILDQILLFERLLKKEEMRVTNIVFMGMGEPLLNLDNVLSSIEIINKELQIGARKISVSTCGIVPGIESLIEFPRQINLAISLHGWNDQLRNKLMPINQKFSLDDLFGVLQKYQSANNRKIMFEYILIDGVNDSIRDARGLAQLLTANLDRPYIVNLIPINKTCDDFSPPDREQIKLFSDELKSKNILTTERFHFGGEVSAACGQLGRGRDKITFRKNSL